MFPRTVLAALLAVTALALGSCGDGDAGSSAANGGVLRVGTEGTYSPFSFHDPKTHELTGYDVEVATAVGKKLGRKVEFSELTFDTIFAGLEAKRYDVVANQISINPERQAKYTFSSPYTVSKGVVVAKADDNSVQSIADVRGKKSAQSTTSNFAKTARDAGAKIEAVEGFTQAVTLLKQGRVDITINDDLAVLDYLRTTGDTGIKIAAETGDRTDQGFVFRKQDTALAQQVDQALTELRQDGTLRTISKKWFRQDVSLASS